MKLVTLCPNYIAEELLKKKLDNPNITCAYEVDMNPCKRTCIFLKSDSLDEYYIYFSIVRGFTDDDCIRASSRVFKELNFDNIKLAIIECLSKIVDNVEKIDFIRDKVYIHLEKINFN